MSTIDIEVTIPDEENGDHDEIVSVEYDRDGYGIGIGKATLDGAPFILSPSQIDRAMDAIWEEGGEIAGTR